ncbi:MAG: hypothetical protein WDN72_05415 [Alphaproteobacteria bacterium]
MVFTPEEKAAYKQTMLAKLGAAVKEVSTSDASGTLRCYVRLDDGWTGRDLTNVASEFEDYLKKQQVDCREPFWGVVSQDDRRPTISVAVANEAQVPLLQEAVERLQGMAPVRTPGG